MAHGLTNETIIVTGATGYIGSALVAKLRKLNEVHVLVRNANAAPGLPDERIHTDLDTPGAVAAMFQRTLPTIVFHLATHYVQHDVSEEVPAMIEANVRFGSVVLDAASLVPNCDVVVTGSHFQLAGATRRPTSFYAATKNALGEIARYLEDARGLQWIQPIIFDTYGPDDPRPKLVTTLISRVASGEPVSLPDPEPLHHFVYIDDVVDALVASVCDLRTSGSGPGRSVYVTSNEPLPPSEVLDAVASALDIRPLVSPDPYRTPQGAPTAPINGSRPVGWEPTVGIREGVKRTATAWLVSHGRASATP